MESYCEKPKFVFSGLWIEKSGGMQKWVWGKVAIAVTLLKDYKNGEKQTESRDIYKCKT